MKGVYIGALSYADDITIFSPSIGGLNEMLKICHIFAEKNSILFNSKKTVCIKFGGNVVRNEEAYLNSHPLLWMDKVRHLGNIIDKDCNEVYDCTFKKSMFIGYVNKLISNFGNMQPSVLANLFKAYCCSFYSSQLWKFNSSGFDKICKSWNIAVRLILGLPYNAHTYLLGPLMGQIGIREQLYIRNCRFLWNSYRSNNYIIHTCISNALYNSNSCIGYKLAFFRYMFNIDMDSNINSSISRLSICSMNDIIKQQL